MEAQSQPEALSSSAHRLLWAILLGGLLIRLALIFVFPGPMESFEYDDLARNLLSGRGYVYDHLRTPYRSFYSGVPYVWLTTGLYAAVPPGYTAVLVAQSVIGTLLGLVVFRIGRDLVDARVGVLAALLTVSHPALVYYDTHKLHPLSFDALAISLATVALLSLRRRAAWSRVLLAGIALGVAILQRGSLWLFVPLALLWLWTYARAERRRSVHALIYLMGVWVAVLPWLARNYVVHGTVVQESTAGQHLWIGNTPFSSGSNLLRSGWPLLGLAPTAFRAQMRAQDEMGQAELFRRAALATIRAHPGAFIARTARKFLYFWTYAPQTGLLYSAGSFYVYSAYYAVMAVLAVAGSVSLARARPAGGPAVGGLLLLLAVFLAVSSVHSVFFVELRHRWSIEPLLLVLSSIGLLSLYSRLRPVAPLIGPRTGGPES